MRRAKKRFTATGAFLKMQPHHRQALLNVQRLDNGSDARLLKSKGGAYPTAELDEFPAG
jgi:hypothetical protein